MNKDILEKFTLIDSSKALELGYAEKLKNMIVIKINFEYIGVTLEIAEIIKRRGEFDKISVQKTDDDKIKIENVNDLFIRALKEECEKHLNVTWI